MIAPFLLAAATSLATASPSPAPVATAAVDAAPRTPAPPPTPTPPLDYLDSNGVEHLSFLRPSPPIITCSPMTVCDITLEPGETVGDIVASNSTKRNANGGWIVSAGSQGDTPQIYVAPQTLFSTSNLIVTTNVRKYTMILRSTPQTPVWVYAFDMPDENGVTVVDKPTPLPRVYRTPQPPRPMPMNVGLRYRMIGDAKLAPRSIEEVDGQLAIVVDNNLHAQLGTLSNGSLIALSYEPLPGAGDTTMLVLTTPVYPIIVFSGDGKGQHRLLIEPAEPDHE